jgi:hypothetical protein
MERGSRPTLEDEAREGIDVSGDQDECRPFWENRGDLPSGFPGIAIVVALLEA